ncbi:hypothetical protein [Curtobacterium sp. MCBA15_001]|uniref:hypothetical protein n=1 Tax=Curtobacterium sp. MCBA15_001 TaxID=1898731 RepID=UPI0008DD7002|nr:hypothetical protein [Curtobacterium sp. MCBA15_001]OIH97877.1 hypothetical protein BIU90_12710 [Curtobacterium sp. MCBA15_001]
MNDEHASHRPEEDAARLGLVVVGEAAALHSGDESALDASEENIRETVDGMVDQPLTDRQEEVVQRLASAGGTLTAGLSGALAAQTGRPVDEVLEGAARSIVWQERMAADRDRNEAELAAGLPEQHDKDAPHHEQRRASDDQRQRSSEDTRRDTEDTADEGRGRGSDEHRRPGSDER